jgi:hypothetical protein
MPPSRCFLHVPGFLHVPAIGAMADHFADHPGAQPWLLSCEQLDELGIGLPVPAAPRDVHACRLARFTNSDCVVRFGGAEAVQIHRRIGQSRLSNGHRDGRFRLLAAIEFVRCPRPDAANIKVMPAKIAAEYDY